MNEILFYWILHKSENGISISNLLYELPLEVRSWWSIKDSTLRSHISGKCKGLQSEGLLVVSAEPTPQGHTRYIYTRVEGNQRLIPDWFKEKILIYLKPEKKVKINCKNCAYREGCAIRQIYTTHNKNLTLTPKIKEDLMGMCKGIKLSEFQLTNDLIKRGLTK